ncbi:PaaI family thioesterase [Zhengella sp. ZM62]|uniref:PaaI family thioesterase n=1 Tax=Zhengella sedimenti TaxID=3390035 RepID=UPI0039763075
MTARETDQERWLRIAGEQPPFGRLLGIRIVSAEPDRVEARLTVAPELGNRNGVMHGGAIIGLADNMGGTATFINLTEGQGTTTVESKTNFFRAIEVGSTITAICEPLHKGRKTMVWQIRILREDGKLAAIVTQTQLII